MAKKKEEIIPYETFIEIFDVIGGSISEDEDEKVLNAIVELPCSDADKIKFLVTYARNLERDNHYIRR